MVTLLVLVGLTVLGLWGIARLEKSLDGYGQLENGSDGSVAAPLSAGVAARYEDGLEVTVGEPRREPGGRAHRFSVTYENGTDATLSPAAGSADESVSEYGDAALVVRAGDPLDDTGPDDGSRSDWLNDDQVAHKLRKPLGEGESLTVTVRVAGDTKGMAVTVELNPPPDQGYRDAAYWKLTLR